QPCSIEDLAAWSVAEKIWTATLRMRPAAIHEFTRRLKHPPNFVGHTSIAVTNDVYVQPSEVKHMRWADFAATFEPDCSRTVSQCSNAKFGSKRKSENRGKTHASPC